MIKIALVFCIIANKYNYWFNMFAMEISLINNCQNFKALPKFAIPVDNRLVRGPQVLSLFKLNSLKKEGVTQVIDLRNTSFFARPIEKLLCKVLGIKYINHRYAHSSTTLPSVDFFESVNKSIIENNGKTYIHCMKGKRRTGMCVAVYEKKNSSKPSKEIIDNMVNLGFWEFDKNKTPKRLSNLQGVFSEFVEKIDTL